MEEEEEQECMVENVAVAPVLRKVFPDGLRILLVDNDAASLKNLDAMMRNCGYKVTMAQSGHAALQIVRENKGKFDLVITDIYMPEMDGFHLAEIIDSEINIPVVMMSVNNDEETVMKCFSSGAKDYLVKPVRMQELKIIWKSLLRDKKITSAKDVSTTIDRLSDSLRIEEDGSKKTKCSRRRSFDEEKSSQQEGTSKKQRISWTNDLHNKFLSVVRQLGDAQAVPKKILELMDCPGLTRENVASHLQKYRRSLKNTSEEQEKKQQNIRPDLGIIDNPPVQQQHALDQRPPIRPIDQLMIKTNTAAPVSQFVHQNQNFVANPRPLAAQQPVPNPMMNQYLQQQPIPWSSHQFTNSRMNIGSIHQRILHPQVNYTGFNNHQQMIRVPYGNINDIRQLPGQVCISQNHAPARRDNNTISSVCSNVLSQNPINSDHHQQHSNMDFILPEVEDFDIFVNEPNEEFGFGSTSTERKTAASTDLLVKQVPLKDYEESSTTGVLLPTNNRDSSAGDLNSLVRQFYSSGSTSETGNEEASNVIMVHE